MIIDDKHKKVALALLDQFLDSGEIIPRKEGIIKREDFQNLRRKIISELRAVLNDFFNNKISLDDFKTKVDSINKKNNHWGFTAIKGQMFFNQLLNTTRNKKELSDKLKDFISLPVDLLQAAKKIDDFTHYVLWAGAEFKDKRIAPKEGSVSYFVSYFWQIFDPEKYPVYYYSTDQVFKKLGFMPEDFGSQGEQYTFFHHLLNELRELFKEKTGRGFSFWDVEHVFWLFHQKEFGAVQPVETKKERLVVQMDSEDYIPPILKEIPKLAKGDLELKNKYEKNNHKVEDVLEDKLYKLFIMLGYETQRLGKGKGRVPDGLAISRQNGYAIIYDAKSRADNYSIGTDSRAIKEYIDEYSVRLHRDGIKNIYFAIISGEFREDQEDALKKIKMETGVQEIVLIKADLLLYTLELKFRDYAVDLGKYGLQQIFSYTGIISKEDIQEYLAGR